MFEDLQAKASKVKDPMYFIDWLEGNVLELGVWKQARETLIGVQNKVYAVAQFSSIPQSAKWHSEGSTLADHVTRIIAGVIALQSGAKLWNIDEFARYKNLQFEVTELEEIICENAATLIAFALVHDIGKTVTVWTDTPKGSKGEAEGFKQNKRRSRREASEEEMYRYLKLYRAFFTKHSNLSNRQVCAKFFDEYEIEVHYSGHARVGASDKFLEAREAVADIYRLTERDRAMLTWLVRNHMDAISFFKDSPDLSKFELMKARANKAGFDADDALDLLVAALFLDATVGSLQYKEGVFNTDFKSILNFLLAEEIVAPQRGEARRARIKQAEKERIRKYLLSSGLSADEVFSILQIPFGPNRAGVMDKVFALAHDQTQEIDFGEHTSEMAGRLNKARLLLTRNP
ncbi:MAG: hypothetical protein Q8P30_02115 [Candidatus Uhrbacteria bacterium]|nr:hypothetical protein [Candidatus Uhrbacteria bacterium]